MNSTAILYELDQVYIFIGEGMMAMWCYVASTVSAILPNP